MSFRVKRPAKSTPGLSGAAELPFEPSIDLSPNDSPDNPTNTAQLLKSFIKQNLQGSNDSFGASSSDESTAEIEALNLQQHYYYQIPSTSIHGGREAVTPEPQPLTRSNVTLHDGIWDRNKPSEVGPNEPIETPLSLSPPLKNLQIMRPPEQRKPWERGASILESLSDAESDQSYSSQDTMILKMTDAPSMFQTKYLGMYDQTNTTVEEAPRPISRLGRARSLRRQKATGGSQDKQEPSTSQQRASPSRRVHFAEKVREETKFAVEEEASESSQHRTISVDYSRILGKGDEDLDDGYESTDNASSTSSSSNGTNAQAPSVDMVVEEDEDEEEDEEQNTLDSSGNLKTDYGYVNCNKVPSFRRMNTELRKKAGSKGTLSLKDNSIESKLKKLFVSDSEDVSGDQRESMEEPPVVLHEKGDEYSPDSPIDADDDLSSLQRWKSADLSHYSGATLVHSDTVVRRPSLDHQGQSQLDEPSFPATSSNMSDEKTADPHQPLYSSNSAGDEDIIQPMYDEWDKKPNIPEQPKRPAPVLVERGSPIRSFSRFNTLPYDSNPNPVHGFYGSQPDLQSRSPQHLPQANRYSSQPQLNRNESKSPNWRPISDLYKEDSYPFDYGQQSSYHERDLPSYHSKIHPSNLQRAQSYSGASVVHSPHKTQYITEGRSFSLYSDTSQAVQDPCSAGSNRSSTSSGVSSNMESGPLSETVLSQTVSEENLNISGSTGSNDSGFEYSAEGASSGGILRPMTPSDSRNRRAPVNYTLDDTSRDPMRLVEKMRRRRDASPASRVTNQTPPVSETGDKAPLKAPLLCPAGSFTAPTGKDFSHLRVQQRPPGVTGKIQPMKALPIKPETDGVVDNFKETARKMLDSTRLKMKEEYSKYVQLFSKFQTGTYECSDDSGSDVASRRSSLPDDQLSSPCDQERMMFNEIKNNLVTQTSMDQSTKPVAKEVPGSPRASNIRYMSSADIFKMLEDKRGRPRSPRVHSPVPGDSEGSPRQSFDGDYSDIYSTTQGRGYEVYRRPRTPVGYCTEGSASPGAHGGSYGPEPGTVEGIYGQVRTKTGGITRHAKNADIYSLYTSPCTPGYKRPEEVKRGEKEGFASMNV